MQDQPTPPTPPAPPSLPTPPTPADIPVGVLVPGDNGPAEILIALRERGEVLADQLERLEDRRGELTQQLRREGGLNATDQKGIETQLADIDARIASVNQQIAASDAAIAQAAGVPGSKPPERPREPERGPPEAVVAIAIVFILAVLMPMAIAYARRLWKRAAVGPAFMPHELTDRLSRLESAVETVAVEVERIGEGQRFVTKLFAEPSARPIAAGAQPIEVRAPATEPVRAARG